MEKDAKLLASDRAIDEAWRGGVGVAVAVSRAEELSDPGPPLVRQRLPVH